MNLPFTKMHGLGNDFIVVPWASPEPFPPQLTARLCDRHLGIGADGILLLVPSTQADLQMIVLNADGSRPEMCGNGLRCAALHAVATTRRHPASVPVSILTDAGIRRCLVEYESPHAAHVSADMGTYSEPSPLRLDAAGRTLDLLVLSVGNPHAIFFTTDDAPTFTAVAPAIASHPHFAHGVNATVARVTGPHELNLQVWERGVGPTLACGTAACASAAAALSAGLVAPSHPVLAHLPGGDLTIEVQPADRTLHMRGPATLVFSGNITVS